MINHELWVAARLDLTWIGTTNGGTHPPPGIPTLQSPPSPPQQYHSPGKTHLEKTTHFFTFGRWSFSANSYLAYVKLACSPAQPWRHLPLPGDRTRDVAGPVSAGWGPAEGDTGLNASPATLPSTALSSDPVRDPISDPAIAMLDGAAATKPHRVSNHYGKFSNTTITVVSLS